MPFRTRCTSVQIPNATPARTTNRTMMMMAMVSFFFTMVAVVVGLVDLLGLEGSWNAGDNLALEVESLVIQREMSRL